ncbi:MAG: hypothetical protein ACI81L_002293 [Verrucomicrobiales bacterium]|jgi:hypothetical protein
MTEPTLVPPPVATGALKDSPLATLETSGRFDPKKARWLVILVPWLWYLVRGIHPYLDYIAIGLPVAIGAAAVIAVHLTIARRSALWAGTLASLILLFVTSVILPTRPIDRPEPINSFRIASINLGGVWYSDNDVGYLDTRKSPNIIIGSELAQSHDNELRERFEHAVSDVIQLERTQANRAGLGPQTDDYRKFGFPSIGVYSDLPLSRLADPIADEITGGLPGIRASVSTADGEVILYALHIPRPGSGDGVYELPIIDQSRMIDAIADAIAAETLPVILVGDLNIVDRSESYRDLTDVLVDGMREERWARPTRTHEFLYSLMMARIDHVLVSEALCITDASAERLLFADHTPIYADIGACEPSSTQ